MIGLHLKIQTQEHSRIKEMKLYNQTHLVMPVLFPVPFPCAVYKRDKSSSPYVFSHYADIYAHKKFPDSLKVNDLQTYSQGENWYVYIV